MLREYKGYILASISEEFVKAHSEWALNLVQDD